jgi:hypothetical protein
VRDPREAHGVGEGSVSREALPCSVPQGVLVSWKAAPFVLLVEAASFVLKAASFLLGADCRDSVQLQAATLLVSWKAAPFVLLVEAASFVLKAASFLLGADCRDSVQLQAATCLQRVLGELAQPLGDGGHRLRGPTWLAGSVRVS